MFPIEMEETEELAIAPSAWQALETAWLGMPAPAVLAHTRRRLDASGTGHPGLLAVRRITGVASLHTRGADQ